MRSFSYSCFNTIQQVFINYVFSTSLSGRNACHTIYLKAGVFITGGRDSNAHSFFQIGFNLRTFIEFIKTRRGGIKKLITKNELIISDPKKNLPLLADQSLIQTKQKFLSVIFSSKELFLFASILFTFLVFMYKNYDRSDSNRYYNVTKPFSLNETLVNLEIFDNFENYETEKNKNFSKKMKFKKFHLVFLVPTFFIRENFLDVLVEKNKHFSKKELFENFLFYRQLMDKVFLYTSSVLWSYTYFEVISVGINSFVKLLQLEKNLSYQNRKIVPVLKFISFSILIIKTSKASIFVFTNIYYYFFLVISQFCKGIKIVIVIVIQQIKRI